MPHFLGKIDEAILHGLQKAYLWFFDRTGVYVASIIGAVFVLAMGVSITQRVWFDVGVLGFMGLLMLPLRWAQQNSNETAYNALSMVLQSQSIRRPYVLLAIFVMIPIMVLRGSLSGTCFQAVCLIHVYFNCLMIRKRDPKSFFEKAPRLAVQQQGG